MNKSAALKTKQVGNVFFARWLPGKSDLSKVFKWRKIKRPLQLCLRIQAIKRHRNTTRKKYTVQLNLDQNSSRQVSRGVSGLIDGASVKPFVIG